MKFSDIPGNEKIKSTLVKMADEGRIPHAQLFHENEGCGALPLAIAFFQYLNCKNRHDGDSCGECPSCYKISRLIHPDLHFVFPVNTGSKISSSEKPTSESYLEYWRELVLADPYFLENELYTALGIEKKSGNIAVAEAKRILERLSLSAVENGYKAVLLFLPEKMNAETANRLLKIVEEPPEMTLFFFITHSPEKVLPTIFSRCQSMRVLPLTKEEVAETLTKQFSIDKEKAVAQANVCGGSVGVALSRLGESADGANYELFSKMMNACLSKNLLEALEVGEEIAALDTREKQKAFCSYASDCVRKVFMLQRGLSQIAYVSEGERALFEALAGRCKAGFCQRAAGYLDGAASLLERNVNPKTVFCDLIDRIFVSL